MERKKWLGNKRNCGQAEYLLRWASSTMTMT
jgi:hypothetical protein